MYSPKDSANKEENQIPNLDLSIFKEHMNQTFLDKLDSLPDIEKLIILAKPCLSKLNYITKFDKVQKRKVKKIEMLNEILSESYESTPLIIYIIPPELSFLKTIENHLSKAKNKMKKQFHIIFMPQITNECLSFINASTFKLYVKLDNLNVDMYFLDRDLLSLEDHYAFYNLYVKEYLNILSILSK